MDDLLVPYNYISLSLSLPVTSLTPFLPSHSHHDPPSRFLTRRSRFPAGRKITKRDLEPRSSHSLGTIFQNNHYRGKRHFKLFTSQPQILPTTLKSSPLPSNPPHYPQISPSSPKNYLPSTQILTRSCYICRSHMHAAGYCKVLIDLFFPNS